MRAFGRIGFKLYKIFVKLVISFVEQYVGDSLALGFKFVNRKPVSFERLELWLKNLPDRVVGDAGPIAADMVFLEVVT